MHERVVYVYVDIHKMCMSTYTYSICIYILYREYIYYICMYVSYACTYVLVLSCTNINAYIHVYIGRTVA
jgi:hypothetical protein